MPRTLSLTSLVSACAIASAWGMYLRQDTVDVPVERIVANLEAQVLKAPADAELHHALARAHAIAYSQGTKAMVRLSRPGLARSEPKEPADERQLADQTSALRGRDLSTADEASRRHLDESIKQYREAIRLAPRSLTAALGYGWTLGQSGDEAGAREQYKDVMRRALQRDQLALAREAGGYLLPLLSVFAQANERAELEKTLADLDKRMEARGRVVTPIVIPLAASLTFDLLVSRQAAVAFDLDGSGLPRRWQWITPAAAWLVYQGTGARAVDSGIRILGSRTFWIFWSDGYAAMRALDDDGDGRLAGRELEGLALWHDPDANGKVDPGEVRPLGEWGIVALSCAHVTHAEGFEYSPAGVTLADGSVRPSYDWIAASAAAPRERERGVRR